ncbi:AMP-binding protein, partial [Streptomyces sp. NPDC057909]|uniref:AMP-binding protein n=1 Tax=Streptomyces sp. NPDC057909 TaxID=3346277 RepID=UPI0036E3523E
TVTDDLLEHGAERPNKIVVISHHHTCETETLMYGELACWVDQFASALLALGARHGEAVSFRLPNLWLFIALHLACGPSGAVTNTILSIPCRREVSFICERLCSRVLVVPSAFRGFAHASMAAKVSTQVDTLEHVLAIGTYDNGLPPGVDDCDEHFVYPDWQGRHSAGDSALLRTDPDSVAQAQFASGTTGEPKGAVHTCNTVYAGMRPSVDAVGLTSENLALAFSQMAHTIGFSRGVTMPVAHGVVVLLQELWDPRTHLGLIRRCGVTWTKRAPPFIKDLCDIAKPGGTGETLRRISCAAAPIPPYLVHRVQDELRATIFAVWGMPEVGAVTSIWSSDEPLRAAETDGSATGWNELAVLGPDGAELPGDTVGQLARTRPCRSGITAAQTCSPPRSTTRVVRHR